jgi:integrase
MWLEEHKRYIRPRTIRGYEAAIKNLAARLGKDLRLDAVDVRHFRRYQVERGKTANPNLINGELVCLQQILRNAGRWKYISEFYKPLPVPTRGAGHSLSQEEEARLREVAFSRPKWRLAAHCMVVMVNTTMGFGELRQLRMRDVDLVRGCVTVREGAKNKYRERVIPLNAQARASIEFIVTRLKGMGGGDPEHYILPHRPRGVRAENWRQPNPWILTEPTGAMTSAFESIRTAAGLPHFRLYDLRVQAITKLLSNPAVSLQVSKEIAGHISEAMQSLYSIQLFSSKKAALDALNPIQKSRSSPDLRSRQRH